MKYKTEYVSRKYPVGKVFKTAENGELEILGQYPNSRYAVRFIDTGYVTSAGSAHIKAGNVKDHFRPVVYGVGYLGIGKQLASLNGKATREYELWSGILERLYSGKYPTYANISISESWKCFQRFADSLPNIPGYEKWKTGHAQLDKDLSGLCEYSTEGCAFISKTDNVGDANKRTKGNTIGHKLLSPNGVVHTLYSFREFARIHSLNVSNLHKMVRGKASTCLGWTLLS